MIVWKDHKTVKGVKEGFVGKKKLFGIYPNTWVRKEDAELKEDWHLLVFSIKDLGQFIFKTEKECLAHGEIMLDELKSLLNKK
jgi:hypothetical protein